MFATPIHFHNSVIFVGKAGAYQSGAHFGTPLWLASRISLVWKWKDVANTLAYHRSQGHFLFHKFSVINFESENKKIKNVLEKIQLKKPSFYWFCGSGVDVTELFTAVIYEFL